MKPKPKSPAGVRAAGLFLALLGAFGLWRSRLSLADMLETRQWSSWRRHSFDSGGELQRSWDGLMNASNNRVEGGGLCLDSATPISLTEPLPRQPYWARLRFEVVDLGAPLRLDFAAADGLDAFESAAPGGERRPWSRWRGPRVTLLSSAEGLSLDMDVQAPGQADEPLQKAWFKGGLGRGSHVFSLRFDGEFIEASVDGQPCRTLLRTATGRPGMQVWFALSGANIRLKSLWISTKNAGAEDGALAAADEARQQGLFSSAIESYAALGQAAATPLERHRLLMRQALAYAEFGSPQARLEILRRIWGDPARSPYSGYAAYDLARFSEDPAAAVALLRRLAQMDPSHPESGKARALLLARLRELGRPEEARDAAMDILSRPMDPWAGEALRQLGGLLPSEPEGLKGLERGLAGARQAPDCMEDIALLRLGLLARLGRIKDYLALASKRLAERGASERSRRALLDDMRKLSWQAGFRLGMESWLKGMAKDTREAGAFFRDYLRYQNIPTYKPYGDLKQDSPLTSMALEFLEKRLDYSRAAREPAERSRLAYRPGFPLPQVWGASLQMSARLDEPGVLAWDFDSGQLWGCLVDLGPRSGYSGDFSGFDSVELRLKAPKGLRWYLVLTERRGGRGGDGERYFLEERAASGDWETARLGFSELRPDCVKGEQDGNQVLDLQDLESVSLGVSPRQGAGTLRLGDLNFTR